MAGPELLSNVYEEAPDEIKLLQAKEEQVFGTIPVSRPSRTTLLQNHNRNIKDLAEGRLPPRSFILPAPYPPARTPIFEAERIYISQVQTAARKIDTVLYVRTIADPYVYSSSITIIEDEFGSAARLTVCNLDDTTHDPLLLNGSVLAIAQPCWSLAPGNDRHIRVDHPSDLVVLDPSLDSVPLAWRRRATKSELKDAATLRRDADVMFLKKRFRKALQIERFVPRHLYLHRGHDPSPAVISKDATSAPRDLQIAHLGCLLESQPAPPRSLKDLVSRIMTDLGRYQASADYDFKSLSYRVGPLTLHLDTKSYISDIEVRSTSNHGRGLFATRQFKTGDLIMAEKAFALPGYIFNDQSSECALYSIGDGTATDRAGALLFKELVQKLQYNPRQRKRFFDLDDGGYWRKNGWTTHDGEDVPVDVFRIEHIRRRNCFSAPLRSLDLLTKPSPVRNGFWIHTSYTNHACLPNSVRAFIGDMLFVRATRDIDQGEEITSQYLAPELAYEARQQSFEGTWGFICDCTLCSHDKSVGKALEEHRLAIFEELKISAMKLGAAPTITALKKFAKRLRDLEALYADEAYAELPSLCLVHPTIYLTEAFRTLKSTNKMIESARKLLTYFGIITRVEDEHFSVVKNVGLVNVEAVRALKYMAEGYKTLGRMSLAGEILNAAKVWFRVITGADVGVEEFMEG
ncbi:SET domain-containing protein [Plenodomus tracheiphilus IPT5]|uniref:SET domain-containing protein n=1 Tax=Plenodomus tracheiphilus IPT5 TaxID=1408161 RepID=A0A6A7ASN3_9PLEO|nr:SET domain-containing protein [Plenodomus tracheiphilus IPT5]